MRSWRWDQVSHGSSDDETLAQHDVASTVGAVSRSVLRVDGVVSWQIVHSRSYPQSCADEVV
jgi:hypothetical protein